MHCLVQRRSLRGFLLGRRAGLDQRLDPNGVERVGCRCVGERDEHYDSPSANHRRAASGARRVRTDLVSWVIPPLPKGLPTCAHRTLAFGSLRVCLSVWVSLA
eukprot:scaffold2348_cov66-Phaeocystis_antarctica.AAC.6